MEAKVYSKASVRTHVAAARQRLDAGQRARCAHAIAQRLQTLAAYREARCVGLYAATPDEVATDLICDQALSTQKRVCYPRVVNARNRQMAFYAIATRADLSAGQYHILEPMLSCPLVAPQEIDCLCLPATAFDPAGHRLGRGAGYYDRWLPAYRGVRVGLAYACQVVDQLPTEPHDQGVEYVVTDQRILQRTE